MDSQPQPFDDSQPSDQARPSDEPGRRAPAGAPPASAESAEALRAAARAHEKIVAELADERYARWEVLRDAHGDRAAALRTRLREREAGLAAPMPERPAGLVARSPSQALDEALEAAASLPAGELGISRPALELRIGIVCDPFLYDTFSGAAELVPITPENWESHRDDVDLLLVAATWRGHDGVAWDATSPQAPARRRLLRDVIVPAYREAGVPTVYYGKEDPPDYRRFLDIARACDHILTTAAECVPDYRRDCPRAQSVEVLPFGVNPLLHTPLGSRPASSEMVFFAGSWMGRKYPERARFAEWILDGVLASGRELVLIDRYWGVENPSPNQEIPGTYWPYRVPAVEHHRLMGLNRVTDVAVNLNSVLGSQTMFANRALELQAAGTLVLSTYNQGLNSYFPQVRIANSARDVAATLRTLGLEELRTAQSDGIRSVFMGHHVVDLLASVARIAGVTRVTGPEKERALAVTDHPTPELARDMAGQSVGEVELVSWAELAERARTGRWGESGAPDILLPLSRERRYSPDYVADHCAAFRFQSAAISVKLDGDAPSADPCALRHVSGLSAVDPAGGDLSLSAWWRPEPEGLRGLSDLRDRAAGARIVVGDHLQHRPARPVPAAAAGLSTALPHAGDDPAELGEQARRTAELLGLDLSVIVPVYNNGPHLRHKAFASLRRSERFGSAHILLIDDGSTDPVTLDILRQLDADHPNVTVFRHPTGGSGSASRPRNTGLDIAATEFVTYLDPDDEEFQDAYRRMTEQLRRSPEADFVLGTQITWTTRHMELPIHQWYADIPESGGLRRPGPDALRRISFRPASIEGIVSRTAWLRGLGLTQPVGATGQDTFFFQQMLTGAQAYLEYPDPAYVYYGAVDHSIVNVISARYFRKYLILEEARSQWLREAGLLQDYLDTRFEHFFVTWYLWKLSRVVPAERAESEALLIRLAGFYCEDPYSYPWRTPEARRFFGRSGIPRPTTLRPMLGRVRRRALARVRTAADGARRTGPGRVAGAVYRRTLKPSPDAARQRAARLTLQVRRLDELRATAAAAEARLEEAWQAGAPPAGGGGQPSSDARAD